MHNSSPRYYPSQPALADLGRVPGAVKSVFDYLNGLPRRHVECWESAATIAAELGISERTVQEAIKTLSQLGYVAYRTDYGLKTRRTIVMLWRRVEVAKEEAPEAIEVTGRKATPEEVAKLIDDARRLDFFPDLVVDIAKYFGARAVQGALSRVSESGSRSWSLFLDCLIPLGKCVERELQGTRAALDHIDKAIAASNVAATQKGGR